MKNSQATTSSLFPIGAVVAFAGNALEGNDSWLLCDGSAYSKDQYEQLYAKLGDTYGSTSDTFNVPNYEGLFLRGHDDDNPVGTSEACATGLPRNPFYASFVNIPNSTMNAGAGTGDNCAKKDGSQTIDTCTKGGDGDTRPVNLYVNRYIRAK